MKNTQSQIKPVMQGKKPGTTYCVCKDYTDDFREKLISDDFKGNSS